MKRDFNEWLDTFRSSICDYKFYVDFEKVYGNIESIKVELNILNSLIGSKNIENDFKNIADLNNNKIFLYFLFEKTLVLLEVRSLLSSGLSLVF